MFFNMKEDNGEISNTFMLNSRLMVKVLLMAIATLFVGCGGGVVSRGSGKMGSKPSFSLPELPLTLSSLEGRSEYLAEHYWDNFDFGRLELFEDDSLMWIVVGGYIQVLEINPTEVVKSSVDIALNRALSVSYDSFEGLTSLLESYLYNPNSPIRNEELYEYVLRSTIASNKLEDIYKLRSRKQLEMVLKNRVGELSLDFVYELADGRGSSSLYEVGGRYTLLFFNTIDCEDCLRVKEYIGSSELFASMVASGDLSILAIYTEGDIESWRTTPYPQVVINGADSEMVVTRERLYDLRALPTMYLLDSDKRVLLKDCYVEDAELYLSRRTSRN